jgi:hypothetical protein
MTNCHANMDDNQETTAKCHGRDDTMAKCHRRVYKNKFSHTEYVYC